MTENYSLPQCVFIQFLYFSLSQQWILLASKYCCLLADTEDWTMKNTVVELEDLGLCYIFLSHMLSLF
jgi:hypothetical protein